MSTTAPTTTDAHREPDLAVRSKHQLTNRLTYLAAGMSRARLESLVAVAEALAAEEVRGE